MASVCHDTTNNLDSEDDEVVEEDAPEDEEWKSDDDDEDDGDNNESNATSSDIDSEAEEEYQEEWQPTMKNLLRPGGKTLLWLCQEGQLLVARQRFEARLGKSRSCRVTKEEEEENEEEEKENSNSSDKKNARLYYQQLEKEVFQMAGRGDKNYPLHEILMGGTSDRNAYQLTLHILDFAKNCNHQQQCHHMLSTQPPSHQRTALHWAAWGNAKLPILQSLVQGYPEALVLRDKPSHGNRTPLEILKHYYYNDTDESSGGRNTDDKTRLHYLEQCTQSWIQHRLRLTIHQCVLRYFAPPLSTARVTSKPQDDQRQGISPLTPFDKNHRKMVNIKPKAWFVLSVLGSLVQREMKPLALHILGFTGGAAKMAMAIKKKKNSKQRKRKQPVSSSTTNSSRSNTSRQSKVVKTKP